MKKSEIINVIKSAIESEDLCRVYFKYDAYYRNYFPLISGDRLFLSAQEDDFILDGFSIRRFADVKKVEIKDDKCIEIIRAEGISDKIQIPKVDLTDWHSAFSSLSELGINIIIEKESRDEDECQFAIGRIEKVLRSRVLFKHFDADGVWQDELYEIPFSQITSITFASRYVDVFSKYV